MKHYPPRPYIPFIAYRRRLATLEQALAECWEEWEGVEVYSEEGRALLTRVHDLHGAITETAIAIQQHRTKSRP